MSLQRFRNLLLIALCVSALTAMYIAKTRQIQAEQSRPFGRYNGRQILARTEPLCSLFTTRANVLRLAAFKQEFKGEPTRRYWAVDCTDEVGEDIASFTWDAENGDLYLVGHRPFRIPERSATVLSCSEAVRIARRWMSDLGIAGQDSRWSLARTPEQIHTIWHIVWQAEGRMALIQIDFRSGDLLQAKSWRQQEHRITKIRSASG